MTMHTFYTMADDNEKETLLPYFDEQLDSLMKLQALAQILQGQQEGVYCTTATVGQLAHLMEEKINHLFNVHDKIQWWHHEWCQGLGVSNHSAFGNGNGSG